LNYLTKPAPNTYLPEIKNINNASLPNTTLIYVVQTDRVPAATDVVKRRKSILGKLYVVVSA
jgi:hypothetical protein